MRELSQVEKVNKINLFLDRIMIGIFAINHSHSPQSFSGWARNSGRVRHKIDLPRWPNSRQYWELETKFIHIRCTHDELHIGELASLAKSLGHFQTPGKRNSSILSFVAQISIVKNFLTSGLGQTQKLFLVSLHRR